MPPWDSQYDDYLRDESKRVGSADSISFPSTEAEVVAAVKAANGPITVQGARTGIVAGCVPQCGHILNLSRTNQVRLADVETGLVVQPGVLLTEVRKEVEKEGLFFPPDPTETSCSIGGMVANNASGAMTFFYGPTRMWVRALRIVLSDGDIISLRRGDNRAHGRSFSIKTEGGRTIAGQLPTYTMPDVKSAAGYYVADNMDLIDLFIGMEGTLGIVTEVEIMLIPRPKAIHGLTVFLPSEEAALQFVRELRELKGLFHLGDTEKNTWEMSDLNHEPLTINHSHNIGVHLRSSASSKPNIVAIELFNSDALDLLRRAKDSFSEIPALKDHFHTAIYTELHGESDEELEEAVVRIMESAVELGGSEDDTWYATTDRELEPLKAFRHATPEAVNLLIGERKRTHPELTKLGTDMSVPDEHLEAVMAMYQSGLDEAGLESVIFGHIGNNHVHVNILPRDMEEYSKGKALYLSWAKRVVALGGSVSAEHGIGKMKAPFLAIMYNDTGIAEMRAMKRLFDPDMILNPGNLF